ncbi:hypothetical protein BJY00DRAFT_63191 [Aspergillus carlsbadensis]|nr:hypothetical protein BJY00DRAFT_63191 [Aspergillus carlsbadensis]
MVRSHIERSLPEPWDQRPVGFQDAIGRRYPIPLEVCGTFEGFIDVLQHAFRGDQIQSAIRRGSIWLFTPVRGKPKTWNIIAGENWASTMRPGMQLGMSIKEDLPNEGDEHPASVTPMAENMVVKFGTPLPAWASTFYPEDAQFNFIKNTHSLPRQSPPRRQRTISSTLNRRRRNTENWRCPNKKACGKPFGSQSELREHLVPEFLTPDSLISLVKALEAINIRPSDDSYLQCKWDLDQGTRRLFEALRYSPSSRSGQRKSCTIAQVYEEGIRLQDELIAQRDGISSCVAYSVIRDIHHIGGKIVLPDEL